MDLEEHDVTLPEGFSFIPEGSEGKYCDFVIDGRIDTGIILPDQLITITFEEQGFYRLIDPDYVWMRITSYVFPSSDSLTFGEGQNLGN